MGRPGMTKGTSAAGLGLFLCFAQAVHAMDGVGFELGRGDDTDMGRISLRWDWSRKWFDSGNWHLTGFWEMAVGYWSGDGEGGVNLWDIGVTPVFRYQGRAGNTQPYVEAGVGAHLLSRTYIDDERDLATGFQFGTHVGLGAMFGEGGRYELGYRLQHLSNGGIKQPNDGINFHQLRFTYRF
jgi:hypothetical protein